ncbi:MAG: hypothetical protein ABI823_04945 [Bryobacteraceae bacterium]
MTSDWSSAPLPAPRTAMRLGLRIPGLLQMILRLRFLGFLSVAMGVRIALRIPGLLSFEITTRLIAFPDDRLDS